MVLSPLSSPCHLTHLCNSCHHLHFYSWRNWSSDIGNQLPKAKPLVMIELGDKSRSNSKARVLLHAPSCLPQQFLATTVVKIQLLWNIHNIAGHGIKDKQWNNGILELADIHCVRACWVVSNFSCVWLFATLWTVARQAPLSIEFSRQEYWSGSPCHPPDPGIEPGSSALQADSLLLSHWGSPDMYTLLCVKQIASGNLQYSARSSDRCSVMT